MTERDHQRIPNEQELLRLVGSTPIVAPSAEMRERARAAFLTGDPARARRRTGPAAFLPLALAASVLALVIWGLQPQDRWTVLGSTDLDGAEIAAKPALAGAEFRHGLTSTSAESELDVQLGDRLRIRLTPTSRAVLPRGPGRWLGNQRRLVVERGEVFGTTHGQPLGFELVLVTPEAEARLLGTTFAVTHNELGPCFCLYDGELEVTTRQHEPVHVPMRMRIQVYDDGRAPEIVDLTDVERMKLQMIQEAGIARLPHE